MVITNPKFLNRLNKEYNDISELPSHIFDEIRNFFDIYKKLEGISVEEKEVEGSEKAKEVIAHCIELYESGLIWRKNFFL